MKRLLIPILLCLAAFASSADAITGIIVRIIATRRSKLRMRFFMIFSSNGIICFFYQFFWPQIQSTSG